jgi:putative addiction module component (TIGR02574 family)
MLSGPNPVSTLQSIIVGRQNVRYRIDTMLEPSIQMPTGFSRLSKAEQVRYIQALWDQISQQPEEIPIPESHLQLVEERLRRHRESPSSAKPAFEVIDRLSEKRK